MQWKEGSTITPSPEPSCHNCSRDVLVADNPGAYQWRLFALCGCGWMSDASALACIAVILPRVKVHFDLGSETAGILSASMMAGVSSFSGFQQPS